MGDSPASGGIPGSRHKAALAAILTLAFALRVWGLGWGLPDALHHYSLHPDETILLQVSLPELGGMNLLAGRFLPHYYNYGTLPFTLTNLAMLLGQSYHLIGPLVTARGVIDDAQMARAYVAARLISVVAGVGTVWAVYALGRRCFGSASAGLIGALLLAVCPLHAQHSHYATVDVGAALWLMLSLVWSAKLLELGGEPLSSRRIVHAAAFAGMFAGLSAATKYSGALVLLSVAAALALRARSGAIGWGRAAGLLAVAGAACAGTFLLACPGCVMDTARFLRDTQYESAHVMHQGEIYFQGTGPGWIYLVARNLDAGMGLPLLLLTLAGLAYGCVIRRSSGDWMLLAAVLPVYLVLGAAQSRYARYEMPLLPVLCVWAGRVCADGWERGASAAAGGLRVRAARVWAWRSVGIAAAAFTLADCAALLAPMSQPEPRERAAVWLREHDGPDAVIGFSGMPWFWSPPLDPNFTLPHPGAWQALAPPGELARLCYNPDEPLDPASLESCRAPYVVLTEYQYFDPLRLKQPQARQYLADLRAQYNPPVVFQSVHPLGGARRLDGLPVQDLPHDMLYPDPTILIYSRR